MGSWAAAAGDEAAGAADSGAAGAVVGLAELPQLTASAATSAKARYIVSELSNLRLFIQVPL
jgi:hypothetical protein